MKNIFDKIRSVAFCRKDGNYLINMVLTPPPPKLSENQWVTKTKKAVLTLALCFLQSLVAQVGFGTNDPDLSSVADFKADDKGILIPRVVLTDLKNPKIKGTSGADAAESLLVYHTDDKDFPEGFYYWDKDNKTWAKISSGEKKSFEETADVLKLEPSHDNAVIRLDAGGSVEIPNDLSDGFQVTLVGNDLGSVLITSLVKVFNKDARSLLLRKNGMVQIIFSMDIAGQPYIRYSGDVTVLEGFVTKWEIPSGSLTAEIEKVAGLSSAYSYDIDWGDGDSSTGETDGIDHTYAEAGTYFVAIKGDFPAFKAKDADKTKIKEIVNWGNVKWESMKEAFKGLTNMKITAVDAPDLSNVSSMKRMFMNCTSLTKVPVGWDLSNITSTKDMFYECKNLQRIPAGWDVSSVTRMDYMFHGCVKLTSILSKWDVRKVTNTENMFHGCVALTNVVGISSWDVSSLTNMKKMFYNASKFNQDISNWQAPVKFAVSPFSPYNVTSANCEGYVVGATSLSRNHMVKFNNAVPTSGSLESHHRGQVRQKCNRTSP